MALSNRCEYFDAGNIHRFGHGHNSVCKGHASQLNGARSNSNVERELTMFVHIAREPVIV